MKKIIISFMCLIILIVFGGCSKPTEVNSVEVTPTNYEPPLMWENTPEPEAQSTLPLFIQTKELSGNLNARFDCFEINNSHPAEIFQFVSGLALVRDHSSGENEYLLNILTGEATRLTVSQGESIVYQSVSPDRTRLVYETFQVIQGETKTRTFAINFLESDDPKEISIPPNWALAHWLNNENILFQISEPYQNQVSVELARRYRFPPALASYNLETGQFIILEPEYPNINPIDPNASWGFEGRTAYNASLTRVIYSYHANDEKDGYAIWDLENSQLVAVVEEDNIPAYPPIWTEDGSRFAVVLSRNYPDLYSVTQDGEETRLTYMDQLFNPGYIISNYVWSPDNHYIAFYISPYYENAKKNVGYQLVIYDLWTHKSLFTCLSPDYGFGVSGMFTGRPPSPIWSLDGSMLLVEQRHELKSSRLLLIDIQNKASYIVDENITPYGWIISRLCK